MKTVLVVSLFVLTCLISSTVLATTYYVNGTTGDDTYNGLYSDPGTPPDGPKLTIQAGINASTDTDTVMVADGIYTGNGNRDLDFGGKAITLQSENGPENTIVDCEDLGRGIYFNSGEGVDSIVSGLTICNGHVSGEFLDDSGGAVCCYYSSPTIAGCTITGNFADNRGGGIYCYEDSPTISDCTITNNTSSLGGAIGFDDSSPRIANTTIAYNTASRGGGIYFESVGSNPTITNCKIMGNSAEFGGGIDCFANSTATIVNCLIIGNSASFFGGGICYYNNAQTVTNCTFSNNKAGEQGGAIFSLYDPIVTLTNCILWDDSPQEIIGATPTLNYCNVDGGWIGLGMNNIDIDPFFASPGYWDNGNWVDGDYHLLQSSPCIDAGTSDEAPVDDIDGDSRPYGDGVDIGADEFIGDPCPTTIYVSDSEGSDSYNGLAPEWDGTHGPKKTIQAGIDVSSDGDTVLVADGTYTGDGNRNIDFYGRDIILQSLGGRDRTIIDMETAARGFHLHGGETRKAVIDGFAILNGRTYGDGGAMLCVGSSPTIRDCRFSNNVSGASAASSDGYSSADETPGQEGGGAIHFSYDSDAAVINCIFDNNRGRHGGGMNARIGSDVFVSHCLFEENRATYAGGGMWGHSSSLVIESCAFRENVADHGGGGLRFDASDSLIANSLFVQNKGQNAGAIRFDNGNMTLRNCTIADNILAGETGGGIYSGGGDSLNITDSIFWGDDVDEIYIKPEDYFEPNITYTDIQGGWAGVGNIDADPMFVRGVFHDYYLKHVAAGQNADSPCIDTGSDTAESLGLSELTTRNDSEPDVGTVDMGYHSPPYDGLYITWISHSEHGITIHWSAKVGIGYAVQYSTDLQDWTAIPAGETDTWTDTSANGYTRRFYRVFEQ